MGFGSSMCGFVHVGENLSGRAEEHAGALLCPAARRLLWCVSHRYSIDPADTPNGAERSVYSCKVPGGSAGVCLVSVMWRALVRLRGAGQGAGGGHALTPHGQYRRDKVEQARVSWAESWQPAARCPHTGAVGLPAVGIQTASATVETLARCCT